MADDPAETPAEKPKPKGGGMGGMLVNGAVTFVLALAAVVVGGFVNAKLHPTQEFIQTPGPEGKLMLKPPPVEEKKAEGGEHGEGGGGGSGKPAQYFAFDPPLIVNFDDTQAVRFLQLQIEVLTRDEKDVEAVKLHQPIIRNNLLMLMNGRDYKTLMTREGKEALRIECLKEVQKILKKETGSPGIEDLYFTSFVVQ
jgi:flagellar FliL protein